MNGILPYIEENFISDYENEVLLNFSKNYDLAFAQSASMCSDPRWAGKTVYLDETYRYSSEVYDVLYDINVRILELVEGIHDEEEEIYCEKVQFSKWFTGDAIDPPHADNVEQDGITPNDSPWRTHGVVLYLNDDFEGGELFYEHLDMSIKPKAKMIAIHGAGIEYTHGVREVTSGMRHTIITFCTTNMEHAEEYDYAFVRGFSYE